MLSMASLREWRQANGVTQEQFEKASGIPQALISKYECGRAVPGLQNALRISRATSGAIPVESWEKAAEEAGVEPKAAVG